MTPAYWQFEARPHVPPRGRAVAIMAALGAVTGLISSLPSPLPEIRLSDPDILVNAHSVPLHAGALFGIMLASMLWLWINRDPGKCFLTFLLTLMGWLAAVNTTDDVILTVQSSALFGVEEGAKAAREVLAWMSAGFIGGGVGAGLIAFGVGVAASSMRYPQAWIPVVAAGALCGLLLYPAALFNLVALILVPWQMSVAAAIAYALASPKA